MCKDTILCLFVKHSTAEAAAEELVVSRSRRHRELAAFSPRYTLVQVFRPVHGVPYMICQYEAVLVFNEVDALIKMMDGG